MMIQKLHMEARGNRKNKSSVLMGNSSNGSDENN
jgi:hypothetical protein